MIVCFPLLAPLAMGQAAVEPQPVSSSKASAGTSSWRATEIMGTNVKNYDDETIGEIQDLIVDFKSGRILGVVISTGGFLGIADSLSSVPVSALHYDAATKAFKTKLTKAQLVKAPSYKKDTWETDKEAMGEKIRAYGETMDVDTSAPDNAARNENDEGLTPMDQGTSEADIKKTKDIRAALMDTELSFNAKNSKIITNNGKVTLRGVVDSEEEHRAIVSLAHNHADPSMVRDQLQVKKQK